MPGAYVRTPEIRERCRLAQVGKIISDETRKKISASAIARGARPPINRGADAHNWKGGKPKCVDCGKTLSMYGYTRCGSCARKGDLNPYKQKVMKENGAIGIYDKIKSAIRNSYQYRQWRSDVFTRDGFACQNCGKHGYRLEAHHILSVTAVIRQDNISTISDAFANARLFDINNGVTLCESCHSLTDNYKGRNHALLKDIQKGV